MRLRHDVRFRTLARARGGGRRRRRPAAPQGRFRSRAGSYASRSRATCPTPRKGGPQSRHRRWLSAANRSPSSAFPIVQLWCQGADPHRTIQQLTLRMTVPRLAAPASTHHRCVRRRPRCANNLFIPARVMPSLRPSNMIKRRNRFPYWAELLPNPWAGSGAF